MLKPEDIEALGKLADDHDRGGFYLRYYELIKDVDPEAALHALREAEIATYSGPLGGTIIEANLLAKEEAKSIQGADYPKTLDDFSNEIVAGTLTAIKDSYKQGGDRAGILTRDQLLGIDKGVWDSHGIGTLYPGNFLYLEDIFRGDFRGFEHGNWLGILNAARGAVEGVPYLGNRADEFADRERYLWLEDDRLLRIIDRRDGHTVFVWDKATLPLFVDPSRYIFQSLSDHQRDELKDSLGADRARLQPSSAPLPPADFLNDAPLMPRELHLHERSGALEPVPTYPLLPVRLTSPTMQYDRHDTVLFDIGPATASLFVGDREHYGEPASGLGPWPTAPGSDAIPGTVADPSFTATLEASYGTASSRLPAGVEDSIPSLGGLFASTPGGPPPVDSYAYLRASEPRDLDALSRAFALPAPEHDALFPQRALDDAGALSPPAFDAAAAPRPAKVPSTLAARAGETVEERALRAVDLALDAASGDASGALLQLISDGNDRLVQRLATIHDKVAAVDPAPPRLDAREVIRIVAEWFRRESNKPRNSSWHYDLRRNYTPPGPIPL